MPKTTKPAKTAPTPPTPKPKPTKLTAITRQQLMTLRTELEDLLKPFGEKYGLVISMGNAKYQSSNVEFKLLLSVMNDSGVALSPDAETFRYMARVFGLKPEHLGQEFNYRGRRYKIIGAKANAPKNPLILERDDGVTFRSPPSLIASFLPSL